MQVLKLHVSEQVRLRDGSRPRGAAAMQPSHSDTEPCWLNAMYSNHQTGLNICQILLQVSYLCTTLGVVCARTCGLPHLPPASPCHQEPLFLSVCRFRCVLRLLCPRKGSLQAVRCQPLGPKGRVHRPRRTRIASTILSAHFWFFLGSLTQLGCSELILEVMLQAPTLTRSMC